MAEIWDDVPGWYDYGAFHRKAIASAPDGATLVEVGVFCGKSLVGLASMAKASGKRLRVIGVDTFRGSEEHLAEEGLANYPAGTLAANAVHNLHAKGVLGDVFLVVAESVRAAELFADQSVHAVLIDAAHDYESVRADLMAWRRKVSPGGWLGGHDYHTFPGVKAAVDETFCVRVPAEQSWWEVTL